MRRALTAATVAVTFLAVPGASAEQRPLSSDPSVAELAEFDRTHGVDVPDTKADFVLFESLPAGATPAERAAAQDRLQARLQEKLRALELAGIRPAGFATASGDPIEDLLVQINGSGGEEETSAGPTTSVASTGGLTCSGDVWFRKRKAYFTPFYTTVSARVSVQCNRLLQMCGTAGFIGPAVFGHVVGSWQYTDGDVQDWCTIRTSNAYMVNRVACLGYGVATVVSRSQHEELVAWVGGC